MEPKDEQVGLNLEKPSQSRAQVGTAFLQVVYSYYYTIMIEVAS